MTQQAINPLTRKAISFEIWQDTEGVIRRRPRDRDFVNVKGAWIIADGHNTAEAETANLEKRKVRTRFFVVKATTTFEELPR